MDEQNPKSEEIPAEDKPDEKRKANNSTIAYFKEHPTLAISLSYLLLAFIGIYYNYILYLQFNLNIFDFIEINDFLVGAFKQPISIAIILFSILGMLFDDWSSRRKYRILSIEQLAAKQAGGSGDYKCWLKFYKTADTIGYYSSRIIYTFLIFAAPYLSAKRDSGKIFNGTAQQITYTTKDTPEKFNSADSIYLIGSTDKFYFFYHKDQCKTKIINVANLMKIETVND